MNTTSISRTASKMPPDRSVITGRLLAGDTSTETLHGARREIAAWADRVTGRGRRFANRPGRASMTACAQAAYDEIARELARRGAL